MQGAGQHAWGLSYGDGFVCDKDIIARADLHDPNPFFATLLGLSESRHFGRNLPHTYGAGVRLRLVVCPK